MASTAIPVASVLAADTPDRDIQVGARVEIEYQGQQYTGTVQKLPSEDSQGRYAVQCDVDPEGSWTFTAVVYSAEPNEDSPSDISVEQAFSSVCFPDKEKLHEASEPQRPAVSLAAYIQTPSTPPQTATNLETLLPLVVTPLHLSMPVDAPAPVQSGGGALYTAELPLHCVAAAQVAAPPQAIVSQVAERGGSYVPPPPQHATVAGTSSHIVVTHGGSYVPPAPPSVQLVVPRGVERGGSYVPPLVQHAIAAGTSLQNVVANSGSYVPPAQATVSASHAPASVTRGSTGSYVPPPARNAQLGPSRGAPASNTGSYVPPARAGSYVPPARGASSYVHPPTHCVAADHHSSPDAWLAVRANAASYVPPPRRCAPVQGTGSYVPPQAHFVSPLGTTPSIIVEASGAVAVPPTIYNASTYRTGSYVPPPSSPLPRQALPNMAAQFTAVQMQQAQYDFAQAAAWSAPQFQQPTYASPPSLTAGLPDPASIASQKAEYMKGLDAQEAQTLEALQRQREQHLAAISEHAEMQRRQILMQIEQQAKQLEVALRQDYTQQVTQTKQQYSEIRHALHQQAITLTAEFQQKHVQEVAMQQQAQLQKEMAASEQQFLAEVQRLQQPANITQTPSYVPPVQITPQTYLPSQGPCHGNSYVAESMVMTGGTGSYVSPPPACFAPAGTGAGSYVPPPRMDLTTVDAGWYMVPSGTSVGMPTTVMAN